MVTIKTLNIAMELWGCVLSALIAVYVQQVRKQMTPRSKAFFMALFSQYMTSYLEKMGKVSRLALNANKVISAVAVALVIVSAFNHMYFVIDADSYYVR